jgi:hypothetical protein
VRVESEQTEDVAGPKQPVEQEGTDAGAADESGSDDG